MTIPTMEVETGGGSTTSNSYSSVADASTYLLSIGGHPIEWDAASPKKQEQFLKVATQYIDLTYGERWKARRVDDDQALDWPRAWMKDRNGFAVESDIVPVRVKRATAYAASKVAEGDNLIKDVDSETQGVEETMIRVGPITEKIKYSGTVTKQNTYPTIDRLLEEFLLPMNQMSRG